MLALSLPELLTRSRQEAVKRLERAGGTRRMDRSLGLRHTDLDRGEATEAIRARLRSGDQTGAARILRDRFQTTAPRRFFEGATSDAVPALLASRMREARDRTLAEAEEICGGRFDLLGYPGLRFGDPPDWHLDPVLGRRSPLVHWSRIDPLDPAQVGDHKVVWELNRHQWAVRLGQAYRLTGQGRYAEVFVRFVDDWLRANPSGMGVNWASSLEVALRLISWCWALVLFREAPALSPELLLRIVSSIRGHAAHVARFLSLYFSPNTHLTGEALGLLYAGTLFPELAGARRWRAIGRRILGEQAARQILPDGVYFEQATCYQRYTAEIYMHFAILSARNGRPVPDAVTDHVQRMLDFLLALRNPDGSVPQIGDADGGGLLPLATRAAGDYGAIFATAAAQFGRSDYAWAAGRMAPETAWLLGGTGARAFEALRPAPPRACSRVFEAGGYAVMRSGWEPDAHQLIFDVGPLGSAVSSAHGHADLLSVQCCAFGAPCVVDPGTYCYTADARWRDYFRGTHAHSSIVVDGESQGEPAGPFSWRDRPISARLLHWDTTDAYDVAEAEHDAYQRLSDPVRHRRRVTFLKSRGWVIVDDLIGRAEHRLEVRFQLAPTEVLLEPDLWVRVRGRGETGLLLGTLASVPLKRDLVEGEVDPVGGWVSPNYGVRIPAPMLVHGAVSRLPLRVVTLLLPARDWLAPPPTLLTRTGVTGMPTAIAFDDGTLIRLDELPVSHPRDEMDR